MKIVDPSSQTNDMSVTVALRQAIERVTGRYGDAWIAPDPERDTLPPANEAAASGTFEPIHEPHRHPFLELCVCLEGRCAIQYEDRLIPLGDGDVILIPPEVVHCEMPEASRPYKALWLAADFKRTVTHVLFKDGRHDALLLEGSQFECDYAINHILHHVQLEAKGGARHRLAFVKTYVLQLLLHTLRRLEETEGEQRPSGGGWKDTIVREVGEYVASHYNRNIRMAELSHQLCVSGNHLNAIFKAATGRTIMRYIEEFKLDKARQWLAESGDSIQTIASRLGYYDQYHFSKTFKKEVGCSPTQYRQNAAGNLR